MPNNPAFIVDGFTEMRIIQKLCIGKNKVVRLDCNGKDVKTSVMVKRLVDEIIALKNHYPIIILVDKEEREISFEQFASDLRAGLSMEEKISGFDLRIGVADEMIENWMIAEDGVNAKKTIGKPYSKTTDGVDLFVQQDKTVIYANSPSFKHFVDQLTDIDCSYLQLNIK